MSTATVALFFGWFITTTIFTLALERRDRKLEELERKLSILKAAYRLLGGKDPYTWT